MRVILWLVALFALLWSGFWFYGARTVRHETEAALSRMKADGRADYSAIDLGGFPARFELTVTDPALADPAGRWLWRAPSLTVLAQAYDPGKIIALLPSDQTIGIAGQTIAVTATDMRASAGFGLSSDLPLRHAETVSGATRLATAEGAMLDADQLRVAIREEDASANRYRLGLEASALTLAGAPAETLAVAGLPAGPGHLRLDAFATFDRRLDRNAAEVPPRITAADVQALEVDWGPLSLRGDGKLAVDGAGQPAGTIMLRLKNWQGLPPLLVAAGMVPPDMERPIFRMMKQLAKLTGDTDELALPLVFQSGWVALGPLPLGPAPRL